MGGTVVSVGRKKEKMRGALSFVSGGKVEAGEGEMKVLNSIRDERETSREDDDDDGYTPAPPYQTINRESTFLSFRPAAPGEISLPDPESRPPPREATKRGDQFNRLEGKPNARLPP
jgi:hypothetical protein